MGAGPASQEFHKKFRLSLQGLPKYPKKGLFKFKMIF